MNRQLSSRAPGAPSSLPASALRPIAPVSTSSRKDVYGAFTNTGLQRWLRELGVTELHVAGFYTHMCLSTSVREALIRGFDVVIDPAGTGARDLEDVQLGTLSADAVRRSALLHLVDMGARIESGPSRPVERLLNTV
jgi:nicotinamidase-related amidase